MLVRKNIIRIALIALISMLSCLALTIDLNKDFSFINSFQIDTISFVAIFIGISFFYYKTISFSSKVDKRGKLVSAILALVYSTIDIIGFTYNEYKESIFELNYIIKAIIRFVGLYIILNKGITILLYIIKFKMLDRKYKEEKSDNKCFNNKFINKLHVIWTKKVIFRIIIVALIITICYLPYLLYYYPGTIFYDGEWQMLYVDGTIELSNHHPVFSTMIIAFFMKLAYALGGDNNLAVTLYCSAQMIINAFIFSYFLEILRRYSVSRKIRLFALLYLALVPSFALNAITLKKDISFALAFFMFSLYLVRMLFEKDFFEKKRNIIIFIILAICTCLLRNNGIYAVALSFPFILFSFRKKFKPVLLSFGITFIICFGWNYYIHNILEVIPSAPKEMLAIPAQAFARLYKYNKKEMSRKDKHLIYTYIPRNDLAKLYDPEKSDPVRFKMDDEEITKNFGEFVSLYFRMLWQFPKTVIDAFFDLNYGYFYPDYHAWRIDYGINKVKSTDLPYDYYLYEALGLEENRLIDIPLIKDLSWLCNYGERVPFINLFYSIGLWIELVLFLIGLNFYNHSSNRIAIFIPILVVWLTCFAAPINGEYRYIYSMFITMPVYILLTLKKVSNK